MQRTRARTTPRNPLQTSAQAGARRAIPVTRQPGRFDPQRHAERMAQEAARREDLIFQEIRSLGESLSIMGQSVEGLRSEVRRQGFGLANTEKRFSELEIQIGEARDLVHKVRTEMANHVGAETEAAAKGAAAGAVQGADRIVPAVRAAAQAAAGKTSKPIWVIMGLTVAIWITTFVEKAPAVFRAINAFFVGVMGLDQ